jgi:hypothetical protein
MAVNKPTGDNARKGAVKKRSQTKTTLGGASAWAKRDKKGVRVERAAAKARTAKKTSSAKRKSKTRRTPR